MKRMCAGSRRVQPLLTPNGHWLMLRAVHGAKFLRLLAHFHRERKTLAHVCRRLGSLLCLSIALQCDWLCCQRDQYNADAILFSRSSDLPTFQCGAVLSMPTRIIYLCNNQSLWGMSQCYSLLSVNFYQACNEYHRPNYM